MNDSTESRHLFATDDSESCFDVRESVRRRNDSLAFELVAQLSVRSTVLGEWRLVHEPF